LQRFNGADLRFKARALLQDFLRAFLIFPERRVFGEGIQFRKAVKGAIPVKDASSAVPART
jgi:hypothetical protein